VERAKAWSDSTAAVPSLAIGLRLCGAGT
jgi:hypothetical protein